MRKYTIGWTDVRKLASCLSSPCWALWLLAQATPPAVDAASPHVLTRFVFVRVVNTSASPSGWRAKGWYADADGVVQLSEESDLALHLRHALSSSVWSSLVSSAMAVDLPSPSNLPSPVLHAVEASPGPSIHVWLRNKSGVLQGWMGQVSNAPPSILALCEQITGQVERIMQPEVETDENAGAGWIRAEALDKTTRRLFERDGLMAPTDDSELADECRAALQHPFRAILVQGGGNPFVQWIPKVDWGRSAREVVYEQTGFQVRSWSMSP